VVGQVVAAVNEAIAEAGLATSRVSAVGMAVPGHIDPVSGVIHWSPNFGETRGGKFEIFLDVPFAGPISCALGIPTFAGNDANVAALGEFGMLEPEGISDIVLFTLGTGIGGGVVSSGRLVTGSTGGAVEIGHHVIVAGGHQCGCGTLGCMEAYCGTDAILDRALRMLERNRASLLWDMIEGDKTTLTPKMISEAADRGDETALDVWEETGYYLGIGMANAVNFFNPQLVVLGGQIRNATGLMAAAERSLRRHAIHSLAKTCRVVEAQLGDAAGVMGGAELARRSLG
jgi:glucokinase